MKGALAPLADILPPLGSLGAWLRQRVGSPTWRHAHLRELAEKVSGDARLRASLAFAMYVPRGVYRPTTVCEACQAAFYATLVTAPSRPTSAKAVAGFDPRAALAGYRSPSRGLVLLPPWGFSRRNHRAFAEMTG